MVASSEVVASANVGCCIFTYANAKFTNVFVRASQNQMARGSTLVNLATNWKIVTQR